MEVIKGGKPDPPDTFKEDLLLTESEVDVMLIKEQINKDQYKKLLEEVRHSSI